MATIDNPVKPRSVAEKEERAPSSVLKQPVKVNSSARLCMIAKAALSAQRRLFMKTLAAFMVMSAVALYALSGLVFGYFSIVKTFALASLFLLGAFGSAR